jgi:hypothetical protein
VSGCVSYVGVSVSGCLCLPHIHTHTRTHTRTIYQYINLYLWISGWISFLVSCSELKCTNQPNALVLEITPVSRNFIDLSATPVPLEGVEAMERLQEYRYACVSSILHLHPVRLRCVRVLFIFSHSRVGGLHLLARLVSRGLESCRLNGAGALFALPTATEPVKETPSAEVLRSTSDSVCTCVAAQPCTCVAVRVAVSLLCRRVCVLSGTVRLQHLYRSPPTITHYHLLHLLTNSVSLSCSLSLSLSLSLSPALSHTHSVTICA